MTIVTVFLSVLIAALLVGNGLLYFIPGRANREPRSRVHGSGVAEQIASGNVELDTNALPLERKIELAHKRIQRLERIVADSKEIETNVKLREKVDRLDNFRSTVETEIIGIKEILAELQDSGMTVKARTFKGRRKETSISGKKMHQIIYRSR